MFCMSCCSVVCHQLGIGTAVKAYTNGYFGSGSSSMPIWLDEVQCTTGDRNLSECSHNGWGNNDCSHSEDAGVACTEKGLLCETFSYKNVLKDFYRLHRG